jgi:hypothetical protein
VGFIVGFRFSWTPNAEPTSACGGFTQGGGDMGHIGDRVWFYCTVLYCTAQVGRASQRDPIVRGWGRGRHTPHPSAGHFASAHFWKSSRLRTNESSHFCSSKPTNENSHSVQALKVCVWAVPLRRYFRTKAPQLLEEMVKIATIPRYQGNPVGWMVSSEDTRALGGGVRGGIGAGCVTYVGADNTV